MAILAGVMALAMPIAGCGSSDDDETLTKAEFIKQGDVICKQASDSIAPQYQAYIKKQGIKRNEFPTEKQGIEIAEQIYLPTVETRVEKLRELSPPSDEEDQVEAILIATEEGVEKAKKNIKALFGQGKDPFEEAKTLSAKYGFKACATI
ncbi:MAG TPA: hypothetical protein VK889_00770 [Solirubrobacterales bacterium]|nr:hypothetical protein [Solirubrobacterales bacterium]